MVEREAEDARTAWVRDRQEAETRLEALRTQFAELDEQRRTLEGLGEESPCPTCGPATWRGVSWCARSRVRNSSKLYAWTVITTASAQHSWRECRISVEALEEKRRSAQQDVAATERRLLKIQHAVLEMTAVQDQHAKATVRLDETRRALAALPVGYDAERHATLRIEVARPRGNRAAPGALGRPHRT